MKLEKSRMWCRFIWILVNRITERSPQRQNHSYHRTCSFNVHRLTDQATSEDELCMARTAASASASAREKGNLCTWKMLCAIHTDTAALPKQLAAKYSYIAQSNVFHTRDAMNRSDRQICCVRTFGRAQDVHCLIFLLRAFRSVSCDSAADWRAESKSIFYIRLALRALIESTVSGKHTFRQQQPWINKAVNSDCDCCTWSDLGT